MRLLDLNPKFIKRVDEKTSREVSSISEADGIRFNCPKCFRVNPDN